MNATGKNNGENSVAETQPIKRKSYRAISIKFKADNLDLAREFGLWNIFWGTDIFIGGVPFMKCLVLANIVAWAIMWMLLK